jgi:hypothetical protein
VAGRVALPGPAAAVAVGEGAVWVLLERGSLLRVDPDRHQVTGRLELGATSGGMPMGPWDVRVGPLAGGPARALRVPVRTRGCTVAASCCGSVRSLGGRPGGFATRADRCSICTS